MASLCLMFGLEVSSAWPGQVSMDFLIPAQRLYCPTLWIQYGMTSSNCQGHCSQSVGSTFFITQSSLDVMQIKSRAMLCTR